MKVLLFWWFHWWREHISPKTRIVQRLFMLIAVLGLSINATAVQAVELKRTSIGSYVGATVQWEVIGLSDKDKKVKLQTVNLRSSQDGKFPVLGVDSELNVTTDKNNKKYISSFFSDSGIYKVRIIPSGVTGAGNTVPQNTTSWAQSNELIQIISPGQPAAFDNEFETLVSKNGCLPSILYDVIVVDGTSAGIGAAVTAAREGLKTCLLESSSLLGGMFTNGIGKTDLGLAEFGDLGFPSLSEIKVTAESKLSYGLMEELRQIVLTKPTLLREYSDKSSTEKTVYGGGLVYRPSVIREAVYSLITGAVGKGLKVQLNTSFSSITRPNDYQITTENNVTGQKATYTAKYIVDATDSGDVAAAAGETVQTTSDSPLKCNPTKNETNGNVFCTRNPPQLYSYIMSVRTYDDKNNNWSYMNTPPIGCTTEGGVEGIYTTESIWKKNDGKDPSWTFESGNLGKSALESDKDKDIYQVKHHEGIGTVSLDQIKKVLLTVKDTDPTCYSGNISKLGDELLDCDTYKTGRPSGYAKSIYDSDIKRRSVVERYVNHTLCFLYHVQQNGQQNGQHSNVGLTMDEDPLRGNFPARLYVREGRRIKGEEVFNKEEDAFKKTTTARPVQTETKKKHSIGVVTYTMDSHATNVGEPAGTFKVNDLSTGPGLIPLGIMIPKDLPNMIVPLAVSATPEGYSTLRMDPTRLNMGMAAALAIKVVKDKAIQDKTFNLNKLLSDDTAMVGLQKKIVKDYNGAIYLYQDLKTDPNSPSATWAKKAIQLLGVWGIDMTKTEYKFQGSDNITRADFLKMVIDVYGKPDNFEDTECDNVFKDVSSATPNCKYIVYAKNEKIVEGYPSSPQTKTDFKPENSITRAEAAKIIYNTFVSTLETKEKDKKCDDKTDLSFPDMKAPSEWYCGFVYGIKNKGYITGREDRKGVITGFYPADNMKRAEAAIVGCRVYADKHSLPTSSCDKE
ncbi:MAG: FAD-dependent oxidoreductase [Thiotrichaceae bacterium]|nr:FAD-dependent oxidoreductase [Thiotrichaceae bacterium]